MCDKGGTRDTQPEDPSFFQVPPCWDRLTNRLYSRSVMSNSCNPVDSSRQTLLSMGFPGKNAGMGCYFLLQGNFLTQGSNPPALADRFLTTEPHGKPNKLYDILAIPHIPYGLGKGMK